MDLEGKGRPEDANEIFMKAWSETTNDFEKFIAAYFVARHRTNVRDKLKWFKSSLQFALKINDVTVTSALPALYSNIAKCFEHLSNHTNAKKNYELASSFTRDPSDNGPFYHGTKADLMVGDLLTPGSTSNYNSAVIMNHIYFTALVNGAGLAAALAKGDGPERVYIVEPTGSFENDPNVTDKKFPGNLTRSYRSKAPLKVVGEITDWVKQTPGDIEKWSERLANNKGEMIN